MTFYRLPDFDTPEDAHAWADREGYQILRLEQGPDGKVRGAAVRGKQQEGNEGT